MHEFRGKPARGHLSFGKIDSPVILFAGLAETDLLLSVLMLAVLSYLLGVVVGVAAATAMLLFAPVLRKRFGRGRVLHLLWQWGWMGWRHLPSPFRSKRSIHHLEP